MNKLLAVIALTIISIPVWSASRTVTLSVPTMDCPVCPITVKKALSNVNGVSDATVNFDKRQAIVTFDDTKTNVDALTNATRNAGYPSVLAENTK
jgi:mercuric ion binding protein